jgi:uncharacterized membrane protein
VIDLLLFAKIERHIMAHWHCSFYDIICGFILGEFLPFILEKFNDFTVFLAFFPIFAATCIALICDFILGEINNH